MGGYAQNTAKGNFQIAASQLVRRTYCMAKAATRGRSPLLPPISERRSSRA